MCSAVFLGWKNPPCCTSCRAVSAWVLDREIGHDAPEANAASKGSKCTPAIDGVLPFTIWKRSGRLIMATKRGSPVRNAILKHSAQHPRGASIEALTYRIAEPVGLLKTIERGNIDFIWNFDRPEWSQNIQDTKESQETMEMTKQEMMTGLFQL